MKITPKMIAESVSRKMHEDALQWRSPSDQDMQGLAGLDRESGRIAYTDDSVVMHDKNGAEVHIINGDDIDVYSHHDPKMVQSLTAKDLNPERLSKLGFKSLGGSANQTVDGLSRLSFDYYY